MDGKSGQSSIATSKLIVLQVASAPLIRFSYFADWKWPQPSLFNPAADSFKTHPSITNRGRQYGPTKCENMGLSLL